MMTESHHSPPDSSARDQATSSSHTEQYQRPVGRSIMMTETVKFEVDYDDTEEIAQTRKQLGLDNRYPIGASGRPMAGSKRVAKSAGSKSEQNERPVEGSSEGQVKVPWGVNPPQSFSFGTLTGNGGRDADMGDSMISDD